MNSNEAQKQTAQVMAHAIDLRNKKRPAAAIASLLPHARILKNVAPAAGLLATLYWDLSDYQNSAKWFARAARLAPRSEKASLGLFHSLWDLGKYDDAFDEMRRFFIMGGSREYTRLLREMSKELHVAESRLPADELSPSELPLNERFGINAAELAGLDWRDSNKLTPLGSLESHYA